MHSGVIVPRHTGLGLKDSRLVNGMFAKPQSVHFFSTVCPDFLVSSHSLKGFMVLNISGNLETKVSGLILPSQKPNRCLLAMVLHPPGSGFRETEPKFVHWLMPQWLESDFPPGFSLCPGEVSKVRQSVSLVVLTLTVPPLVPVSGTCV